MPTAQVTRDPTTAGPRAFTSARWLTPKASDLGAYSSWTMSASTCLEWGTPDMFEDGLIPEKILGSEYGHRLHFWDLLKRRHLQEIDLGKEYQLNPTHYPR